MLVHFKGFMMDFLDLVCKKIVYSLRYRYNEWDNLNNYSNNYGHVALIGDIGIIIFMKDSEKSVRISRNTTSSGLVRYENAISPSLKWQKEIWLAYWSSHFIENQFSDYLNTTPDFSAVRERAKTIWWESLSENEKTNEIALATLIGD
jgi:hypothetical protein